jgi:hypothetical protein
MAQHGEVKRWSSDSEPGEVPKHMAESEEPTEFGVVWERYVIKETEEAEVEPTIVELHIMNEECKNTRPTTIWEQLLPSEQSSSRLSDFESDEENPSQIALTARQRTDAYWEGVLQSEFTRLEDDEQSRVVAVEVDAVNGWNLRSGFLSVGEWVEVDADRTPGWNSEGGIAVIINVHDNFADVK